MSKFTLVHTVLYAKGWYKKTDFWEDIKKCLTADDYSGEYFTNGDCVNVIMGQFQRLVFKEYRASLLNVIRGIQDNEIWKCGYYTTTNCPWIKKDKPTEQYELNKAIVMYCLSQFSSMERSEFPDCYPDFDNCLPIRPGIDMSKVEEVFGPKRIEF